MEEIKKVLELADASVKRFLPQKLAWQWGQALFLYGLSQLDIHFATDKYTDYLKSFYDYKIKHGYKISSSDTLAPCLGAFDLYKKTGKGEYEKIVRDGLKYLEESPKILEGLPNHQGTHFYSRIYPKSIWIDSIMMYGVFASKAAKDFGDKKLLEFAEHQPRLFTRYLFDRGEGLFYHSYWTGIKMHYPINELFWGRGNGWFMAAIALFIDSFENEKEKEYSLKIFVSLAKSLLKYQREDGYFETVLNKPGKTYKESSATMLIASGWFYGYRTGLLGKEYFDAAVKAFNAVVNDFEYKDDLLSMPHISGPTSAIPLVPYFVYKNTPTGNDWSYGLASAFFAAIEYEKALKS